MTRAALCAMLLSLAPRLMQGASGYLVHNLIADMPGVADLTDPNLVNGWGISISATSPFWICDGGTGLSSVYTAGPTGLAISATKASLPSPGGETSVCTGVVFNSTQSFPVGPGSGRPASFIFATEGGTISGWNNAVDPVKAQIAIDNSAVAVYKGLALVGGPNPQLYAANFKTGTIDVFDANWKPVPLPAGAFADPTIPDDFAPFNIQNLNGKLYVTYARQTALKVLDAQEPGNGYVNVFDPSGHFLQRAAERGTLNSPWGVQIAPPTFGRFAGALLVGNFGDGIISAFDPSNGVFLGALQDQGGRNIRIDGLWGLQFGNGGNGGDPASLYFTAGPSQQHHGIFGVIVSNPVMTGNVVNAGTAGAAIAPNTFISIVGGSLSVTARTWQADDFKGATLPTTLDNVGVTVNGQPAFVAFVSPRQINILTPADMAVGAPAQIVVNDNGLVSAPTTVPTSAFGPAFFLIGKYGAAVHGDGTVVGPDKPAKPGETIALFATGLGNTTPGVANGRVVSVAAPLAAPATVEIGGAPARVTFAGLTATGLYQVNVEVPATAPDGDNLITVAVGGYTSPGGVFVSVAK